MHTHQSQALVSIIIPTLNEERNISYLLESLSTWAEVEIIVCDGGSSDATVEVCHSFPVQLLSSPMGRGVQLNTGAQSAAGEILLFLHADSLPDKRVVDDIRDAVSNGHLWGCCTLKFNEDTPIFRIIACLSNIRSRVFSSCFGDQGIYCQRDLFREIGGFPETVFLEDIGFSHQLRRRQMARVVKGIVTTSSRRFRGEGVWKTILKNQLIKMLFAFGAKPERLLKLYKSG